jgi:3-mercaptopyruvate sulfurtransferase SseA
MTRAECEHILGRRPIIRRAAGLGMVALVTACLIGCPQKTDDNDLAMVSPEAALEAMQTRSGVLGIGKTKSAWVDPRSLDAYRKGHIPGAVHLPFADVADDHEFLLEDVNVIVVYGDDYNDVKAKAMSKRLIELGYKDVRTLTGGLRQWTSQGHEIETGDPSAATASQ